MVEIRKFNTLSEDAIKMPDFHVHLRAWHGAQLTLPAHSTHFGVSLKGGLIIDSQNQSAKLPNGGFFRIKGSGTIDGDQGIVFSMGGDKGFTQISGPIEAVDLSRYPAGGRQNCLIWPAAKTFPTLNRLVMLQDEVQEDHWHDSLRVNIVTEGTGICITPGKSHDISAGHILTIPANESHRFQATSPSFSFFAFHPDSHPDVFNEHNSPMALKTFGLKLAK